MRYKPKPIDTSKVKLSGEILELTELLAKNAHDIWGQQRISDGWIWGLNATTQQRSILI